MAVISCTHRADPANLLETNIIKLDMRKEQFVFVYYHSYPSARGSMSGRISCCCSAGTLEPAADGTPELGSPTPSDGVGTRGGDGVQSRVVWHCEPSSDMSCPVDISVTENKNNSSFFNTAIRRL
jgi:hypothetical protein